MTYTSQADLVERFGARMLLDLTDRATPPAGEIDAGVVTRALEDTDAAINGFLLGRYRLPLPSTPPMLRDIAQAVAIYKMHRDVVSEKIRLDYLDAMKLLGQIGTGAVRLDIAGVEPASSGASGVQTIDRERELTPESLKGFI
ncbi:gp436 family protein [Nitrobacter winogradskyi]|uniref:Phage gp36-like protein n=2 Tax=Nitrobacter winogradskyi TaxID=913 RepID=A0ACC6AGB2_NITWI|nr:DUF1320 domain-containing protein [Nitrobacter winogradskyi]MCP1998788.1 phage gp36-like protein [Nitrobacter winogradskyi]GEC14289.1 hypothetical protein NWI01_01810 [Nitrobacter winogradskyi]